MRLFHVACANVADTKSVASQLHPMPTISECQQQNQIFFESLFNAVQYYCVATITQLEAHNPAPYQRRLQRNTFPLALAGIGGLLDQPYSDDFR